MGNCLSDTKKTQQTTGKTKPTTNGTAPVGKAAVSGLRLYCSCVCLLPVAIAPQILTPPNKSSLICRTCLDHQAVEASKGCLLAGSSSGKACGWTVHRTPRKDLKYQCSGDQD